MGGLGLSEQLAIIMKMENISYPTDSARIAVKLDFAWRAHRSV